MSDDVVSTELLLLALEPTGRLREDIERVCGDAIVVRTLGERTPAELEQALRSAEIVIGGWEVGLALTASTVAMGPRVRFIQQPGAGVDFVDLDAWAAAGVPVANASGTNAQTVAEWAVGATLSVARGITWADNELQNGVWTQQHERADDVDLSERTVGVIGMGQIGQRAAEIFEAIGCPIVYTSRTHKPELPWPHLSLDELAAAADVVVLATPLTDSTRRLVDARLLGLMKPSTILVNVARGAIVDEEALCDALDDRSLAGAALDVFATEPLPPTSRLLGRENVLVNAHRAGVSESANRRLYALVAENVRRVLDGLPPLNLVNSPRG